MMLNNNYTPTEYFCPVCKSPDNDVFLEITRVPVHCNLLWEIRNEAVDAPRSDITLAFCENCGHIFNHTFDPEVMKYFQQYENSLHFSQCFQNYAKELVDRLIASNNLYKKDIIEIGCGKGEFLKLLCETGENRGIGFDPSYEIVEPTSGNDSGAITFIKDFYSKQYSDYKADFICCRHVLEHIEHPYDFLFDIRKTIGGKIDTIVFFEVPNVDYTLKELGIWDLIYEHISYFNKSSLHRLFSLCGFSIIKLTETFNGQFLCIEAVPGKVLHGTEYTSNITRHNVELFAEKFWDKIETWQKKIEHIQQSGQSAVVWGAGSKGVTFLNLIDPKGQIKYIIDINPRKQGKYVPGTGQKILPPEFLREYQPDVVLVMNVIYNGEIQQILDSLGVSACLINV